MRRNDSSVSQGSAGGDAPAPARQRPSLKLAPRTKPVDESAGGQTKASIFGGARPRDESKFVEKKESSVDDAAVKEATGSMKSMNVKDESGDATKVEATDAKTSEPSEKQPPRRQDSKTGGRGGRKDGRRDNTRKSGKDGDRRGGGRGDKNRGRGEGGRNNGKRNATKSNGDSSEKPQSSLAVAAASGTAAAQTETKKAPPKKTNSFAAFMDDSDED